MFSPLHIRTGYSFLKSGLTIDKIVKAVIDKKYYGAGICDFEVMHGVPTFIDEMSKINKPFIFGVEMQLMDLNVCVYALDEDGYRSLCNMSAFIQDKDKVIQFLKSKHNGLLGILSTTEPSTKQCFEIVEDAFIRKVRDISNLFEDFYIGIDINKREDIDNANKIRAFAEKFTYLTIAFPLILYVKKEDRIVLEIAKAIDNDDRLEEKEMKGNRNFKVVDAYKQIYTEEELNLTHRIIDSMHVNFQEKRGEMLSFPCDGSIDELKRICYENLEKIKPNNEEYKKRLDYELDVIITMGYADYFLIVADYVKYANSVGILTGPGRGSAAGSLVSYLMGITKIDPLKYGLLFERFLNPARKKMPDIDIDFMDTRRDEVVAYLKQKYGVNKVANIVTFSTILAKQSLRDIGRIYNYQTHDIDLLSSRLLNNKFTLRDSYRNIKAFRQLVDSDKWYLDIVALASKIENLPRQSGLHAAGIVLNNTPIEYSLPVTVDFQGNYITQYEMGYLEKQGFLKMDLLGLRNLTIISDCCDLVNARYKDAKLDKFDVPFDEPEVFELIASNKTMGVFQLESSGMKNAISQLKPSCFNDIVALLALFRPGPMESIPVYARRKQGLEKPTYISDDLKDILAPTYGIIVYQEQIIQIAQKMAGFSLSQADAFRQAISKKNIEEMKKTEADFIDGSVKKGYSLKTARDVYNHILRFANYGFNKSHSVGYSIIACQMAYLKVHYPLEFYSTILSSTGSINDSKFLDYVYEMKMRNIELFIPDINEARDYFVVKDKGLMLPLTSIKGVPGPSIKAILYERDKNGKFRDYFDFICRMHVYKITENQFIKIINSGALDSINSSRATLKKYILQAMQFAEISTTEDGQLNIGIEEEKPYMIPENDDPIENLELEYDTIGIMLSNNPLEFKKDLLEKENVIPINVAEEKNESIVAGIIKSIKVINTKKGTPMAFVKIFDQFKEMELTLFSDCYQDNINLIKRNNIVVCKVRKNIHANNLSFIVEEIHLLED